MKTHHKTTRNPKKLYKSNPVYFQIGLVISLALVYFIFQLALPKIITTPSDLAQIEEDDMVYITDIPPVKKEAPKIEKQPERKKVRLVT